MKLYILGVISYHNLCARLLFCTRFFHSEHNCLTYHNIYVLYKTVNENPNTNSYSFHYCQLLLLYFFTGISKNVIIIIFIFTSTCLYTEYSVSYFCYISYTYDIGRSLVRSKIFSFQLSSNMDLRLWIFNTVQFLYCVIFNNHISRY